MMFSPAEMKDLVRAWLLLSLAFAIVFAGFSLDFRFFVAVLTAGFTAGTGFLLHELAHKFVAQKYGCHAEFHAFDQMLWLAVLMSFFGFIFAAPGAVMIRGRINARKNGLISLAGPLTNLVLGILFAVFSLLSPSGLFRMGVQINLWLAVFNMLPFFGLDGTKVLAWNKKVYALFLAIMLLALFGVQAT